MSKLMNALAPMMGGKSYCPDCGASMGSNGSCKECGYNEDDGMEEEDDSAEMQTLLDIKNELQRVMDKIDRLIVQD
jgi:tRNA(Ile2) C34 agmatinyltransferase TiaS